MARAPADTNGAASGVDETRIHGPAAPPAPEDAEQAEAAALASGRSRHSWKSPRPAPQHAAKRTANRPLKEGLAIRPADGYSSETTHMSALLAELSASRPQSEDRASTRS